MFKKTCFECGAKVDKTYNSLCEDCFKAINPPILEVKPINFKYCNSCKKISYNNHFYTRKEIDEMIENIVKKHLVIDKNYELNFVDIQDFKIEDSKVSFDIEVDCDLREK